MLVSVNIMEFSYECNRGKEKKHMTVKQNKHRTVCDLSLYQVGLGTEACGLGYVYDVSLFIIRIMFMIVNVICRPIDHYFVDHVYLHSDTDSDSVTDSVSDSVSMVSSLKSKCPSHSQSS